MRELSDSALACQLEAYLRLRDKRGMSVEQYARIKDLTLDDAQYLLGLLKVRGKLCTDQRAS